MPHGGARAGAGHPTKPTALKVLQGNPGRRPLNQHEPQPAAAKLKPPRWLGHEGRKVWREYASKVHALGLLTELDIEMFAQGCALAAEARILRPASADHLKAVGEMGRILGRFGFTPSDRTKLSIAPKKEDPFEEFLGRKAK